MFRFFTKFSLSRKKNSCSVVFRYTWLRHSRLWQKCSLFLPCSHTLVFVFFAHCACMPFFRALALTLYRCAPRCIAVAQLSTEADRYKQRRAATYFTITATTKCGAPGETGQVIEKHFCPLWLLLWGQNSINKQKYVCDMPKQSIALDVYS